jgi:hypothetical protein
MSRLEGGEGTPTAPGAVSAGRVALPGLDCGLCGSRTCAELAERLSGDPGLIKRCTPLSGGQASAQGAGPQVQPIRVWPRATAAAPPLPDGASSATPAWTDGLGREFDFLL